MTTPAPPVFDCLILSGGGAKGAYGAGAAYALFTYYEYKKIERQVCYIGTSAGALNACVLASYGPERLKDLWLSSVSNRAVLGKERYNVTARIVRKLVREKLSWKNRPFSIFSSDRLRSLIAGNTDFAGLAGKHLIFLTTNYTSGKLTAFYASDLLEQFKEADAKRPLERRRLGHFRRIEDGEHLTSALLASASIPIFFPPVLMGGEYHVDGGVGNNTPTREAAYFLRFLQKENVAKAGEVFCVKQDPPGIASGAGGPMGFLDVLKRTTDVAQYIHMEPIIEAWYRINYEVAKQEEKVKLFVEWLRSRGYDPAAVKEIEREVVARLAPLGGETPRGDFVMHTVGPSSFLGDTLDFSPASVRRYLKDGYEDMLTKLESLVMREDDPWSLPPLTPLERKELSDRLKP